MEKEISNALAEVNPQFFKSLIHEIRGTLVMLDADLAAIYGYSTKAFNQQISRNIERFDEEDFMFQLNEEETRSLRFDFSTSNEDDSSENLKSQIVTSNRGGRRYAGRQQLLDERLVLPGRQYLSNRGHTRRGCLRIE